MPPRFAYWTILIDNTPTAFRAQNAEDLLPTLVQLRRTNKDVVMKWFARGRLWESPEAARSAAQKPKVQEKRGRDWRPGGEHKDPRARFAKPRHPKGGPPAGDRPFKPTNWRTPAPGSSAKQEGTGDHRRPWAGKKPGGHRPPWSGGKPGGSGGAGDQRSPLAGQQSGSTGERRPWTDNKPSGTGDQRRPWTGKKPGGPGDQRRPWADKKPGGPGDQRRPWAGKKPGGPGDQRRPWAAQKPGGPGDQRRPWAGKKPGGPGDQRRPWAAQKPGGPGDQRRPWTGKKPDGGFKAKSFDRKPWSNRGPKKFQPHPKPDEAGQQRRKTDDDSDNKPKT